MLQFDNIWSYGIGSSFALASFRQLRKLRTESGSGDVKYGPADLLNVGRMIKEFENAGAAFNNEYFMKNLAFLSLLFVPCAVTNLWADPSWESMHVGDYDNIPNWMVAAFGVTLMTQGMLGFWTTYNYLMRGKYYRAALQTVLGYAGFFSSVFVGWDRQGYRRFFSKDREALADWKWSNVFGLLAEEPDVRILGAFGIAFVPLMVYWLSSWLVKGYEMDADVELEEGSGGRLIEQAKVTTLFGSVVGLSVGLAGVAAALINRLGWVKGLGATSVLSAPVLLGVGPWLTKRILKVDSLVAPAVWETALDELAE
jgi:hypothetical protein